MRVSSRTALVGLWILASPGGTAAAQTQTWPEFRGPGGQGHAPAAQVPLDWSESKNVAWKVPVAGSGWSSPVVGDGRVWLTTAVAGRETSLRALAFDMTTGKEIVNVEVFRSRPH